MTKKSKMGPKPFGGSAEAADADRDERRHEYVDLRARLNLPSAALSKLLGLSPSTLRNFPGWTTKLAPTRETLTLMRAELVRQAQQTLEDDRIRREIERDIAIREAQMHIEKYGLAPDTDDDREAA